MLYDIYIKTDEIRAVGLFNYANESVTVIKGSQRKLIYAKHFEDTSYYTLMRELEERGILKGDKFTEDYVFSSPSVASSIIMGSNTNGKIIWKTIGNKTIKETIYKE